jgi:sec-independent protein translocase protein TatA
VFGVSQSAFSVTFAPLKLINMQVQQAIFNMGPMEITLVVLAILLLFGGKKIPELMRGIGQGIREFNSAKSNLKSEIEQGMKEDKTTKTSVPSSEETKA